MRIQFAFEMELIPLFYRMHYNKRPGLGLQCAIVVFPDHTHLFFLVVNIHSKKKRIKKYTTADTESVGKTVCLFFVYIHACK